MRARRLAAASKTQETVWLLHQVVTSWFAVSIHACRMLLSCMLGNILGHDEHKYKTLQLALQHQRGLPIQRRVSQANVAGRKPLNNADIYLSRVTVQTRRQARK